jgi:hypothetical protein
VHDLDKLDQTIDQLEEFIKELSRSMELHDIARLILHLIQRMS